MGKISKSKRGRAGATSDMELVPDASESTELVFLPSLLPAEPENAADGGK
jgi:hypothetical protein